MKVTRRIILTLIILLPTITTQITVASAETVEISVTGNGEGSSNEVNTQTQNTTTVEQNNNAQVNNNVETNANTGGNEVNGNGGEANIDTGDVTTQTEITNENINTNVVHDESCNCDREISTTISGNGSDSKNTVNLTSSTYKNVVQNNNASITNNKTTNANTGNNQANNNTGNVYISTGNIVSKSLISNKNINNTITDFMVSGESVSVKIFGNGEASVNYLSVLLNNNFSAIVNNSALINNNSIDNLNTGGNQANGNLGNVSIITGDIHNTVTIENIDINSSFAKITCDNCVTPPPCDPCEPCHEGDRPKNCDPGKGEQNPPNNGTSTINGISHSSGEVLGAGTRGAILPATGNYLTLWATIAALVLFFVGWYLRFRSGCAPGFIRQ